MGPEPCQDERASTLCARHCGIPGPNGSAQDAGGISPGKGCPPGIASSEPAVLRPTPQTAEFTGPCVRMSRVHIRSPNQSGVGIPGGVVPGPSRVRPAGAENRRRDEVEGGLNLGPWVARRTSSGLWSISAERFSRPSSGWLDPHPLAWVCEFPSPGLEENGRMGVPFIGRGERRAGQNRELIFEGRQSADHRDVIPTERHGRLDLFGELRLADR